MLLAAGGGEESAWCQLIDLYARRVFALIRSRVSSPELAEEITQSVFVTVATKLGSGQYAERGRFEAWLFRIAMNRLRDEVRRAKRHATPTAPETMAGLGLACDRESIGVIEPSGEVAMLRDAMGQLSEPDREVIHLRHHAGLSFKQIADLLGEPLGTMLARHHRALRKLKALMIEQGITREGHDQ